MPDTSIEQETKFESDILTVLRSPDWESFDVNEFTLDQWIKIAKLIRRNTRIERNWQLVARVQCLVVKAGLIDDASFVERVQAP